MTQMWLMKSNEDAFYSQRNGDIIRQILSRLVNMPGITCIWFLFVWIFVTLCPYTKYEVNMDKKNMCKDFC